MMLTSQRNPVSAMCGFALLAVAQGMFAQVTPAPTGFQTGGDVWTAPPGVQVSVDRRTGHVSMALPIQPSDGSREQVARFAEWRLHPYSGTGPYPSSREEPVSLPTHTIYLPADLSKAPKLPILLWANGGCRNTSVEFTRFLGEVASHGYLVVAIGRSTVPFMLGIGAGQRGSDANASKQDSLPLQITDPSYLLKGLDWAIAENSRKDSELYGKLDIANVATLGQSCGGPQAFGAARDPRVRTVLGLNSSFPSPGPSGAGGLRNPYPDWTVDKLSVPAALFEGGPADGLFQAGEQTYKAAPANLPILKANMTLMGHTGAYPMPDTRWCKGVLAWLDWTLKGDSLAKQMFTGTDCVMCKDPDWWIETRNIQ